MGRGQREASAMNNAMKNASAMKNVLGVELHPLQDEEGRGRARTAEGTGRRSC